MRMRKAQFRGMQENAAESRKRDATGVRACGCAVESVTHERMAGCGEMRANLVGASSVRLGGDEGEGPQAKQHTPIGPSLTAGTQPRGHTRPAAGIARNG